MAKMIEPDKLAHELERFHFSTGHLVKIQAAMEAATVDGDFVNVVRCKDCVYGDVFGDQEAYGMPMKCLDIRYGGVESDWYCEHGERRPTCGEEGRSL